MSHHYVIFPIEFIEGGGSRDFFNLHGGLTIFGAHPALCSIKTR